MRAILTLCMAVLAGAGGRTPQQQPRSAAEQRAALAKGNTEFAVGLCGKLKAQEGNLFLSPYSISTALAMAYAGARGETAAQMAQALHFPLPQERLHPALSELAREVAEAGKAKGCTLSIANALWQQQGYGILEGFRAIVRNRYLGELQELDFVRNAEAARQTINGWVEHQTEGKIQDIIAPGVLNALTRLVLTNAIYFKGMWLSRFDRAATIEEPFWISGEKSVPVPMMNQTGRFRYAESEECQVLELPYVGDAVTMVVVLPKKKDGLPELENRLNLEALAQWLSGLREREVVVALPRFKLTSQFQLNDVLQAMGMSDAFTPAADLSGISGRKDLFISAVIHKAFVDVNEEGTEAAAATAVAVALTAMPQPKPVFRADRPFLFLIRHVPTGSILFLGRLVNPKE